MRRTINVHGENDENGWPWVRGFGGCAIGRKTRGEPAPGSGRGNGGIVSRGRLKERRGVVESSIIVYAQDGGRNGKWNERRDGESCEEKVGVI